MSSNTLGRDRPLPPTNKWIILWVRWYALDDEFPAGFSANRLHRVGFIDRNGDAAFGFLGLEGYPGLNSCPSFR
jgi:hypothetical protein